MSKATMLYGENESTEKEGGAGSAVQFISKLLDAVTTIHKAHLMTNGLGSFAAHEALGDVYEGLQEGIDGLAESFMGCQETGLDFSGVDMSRAGAEVRKIYEYIEMNRDMIGSESHLQNLVDEILDKLARNLFKLDRLS